jgi:hypothetical protein
MDIKQIDVTTSLENEEFVKLFTEQLPLTEGEVEKIQNVYYAFYVQFISSGVHPEEAWLAVKNLFISQEPQIGERIKNGNN